MDFSPFEYINDHLPEGMGLMTCHAGGIFEHLSQIMSLEGLCLALYDQPDLVEAVCERIGELIGHTEQIRSLAISPNGEIVISGGADQVIRVWNVEEQTELGYLRGHTGTVHRVAFPFEANRD